MLTLLHTLVLMVLGLILGLLILGTLAAIAGLCVFLVSEYKDWRRIHS